MDDSDLTAAHVRAARALLDWNSERLAKEAEVSHPTVMRLEAARGKLADAGAREATVSAIRQALERAGIEFQNGGRPGVRLTPKGTGKPAKAAAKKR